MSQSAQGGRDVPVVPVVFHYSMFFCARAGSRKAWVPSPNHRRGYGRCEERVLTEDWIFCELHVRPRFSSDPNRFAWAGEIPSQRWGLVSLKELRLSGNELSGERRRDVVGARASKILESPPG